MYCLRSRPGVCWCRRARPTVQVSAVNITVEPAGTGAEPGETTTYEVAIEGPKDGIDGYAHLDIVIEEPLVAQFVEFNETAADNVEDDLPYSLTEIQDANGNETDTGPVVSMEAALTGDAAFDGAGEIVIAELDTVVTGIDTSPVSLIVEAGLRDIDGVEYTVGNETGSLLEPVEVDVNGNGKPATDTNGDSKFEDVDGNGGFDIFDMQAFFVYFDTPVVQDSPEPFEFNEGGSQTGVSLTCSRCFPTLPDDGDRRL